MKKALILFMLAGVMALSICACKNPESSNGGAAALNGVIIVNPKSAEAGDLLAATYSEDDEVTFQWKKDGNNAGPASKNNPNIFWPEVKGSYTVTVSLSGLSKTSDPVIVSSPRVQPLSHLIKDYTKWNQGDEIVGIGAAPDGEEAYFFSNKVAGSNGFWELLFTLKEGVDASDYGYFVFDLMGDNFAVLDSIQSSYPRFWTGSTTIVFLHQIRGLVIDRIGGAANYAPPEWLEVAVPIASTNLNEPSNNYNNVMQNITSFRLNFGHRGTGFYDTEQNPANRSKMYIRNFRLKK